MDNALSAILDDPALDTELNSVLEGVGSNTGLAFLMQIDILGQGRCSPFPLSVFWGRPVSAHDECDAPCVSREYCVETSSVDVDSSAPHVVFSGATLCDGRLTAGGSSSDVHLVIPSPLLTGEVIPLDCFDLAIEADVVVDVKTGIATLQNGVIGGAVQTTGLIDLLAAFSDPDSAVQIPLANEAALAIATLVTNDIAVPGDGGTDGSPNAASFSLLFSSAQAVVDQEHTFCQE
jgi:hypothetical protein